MIMIAELLVLFTAFSDALTLLIDPSLVEPYCERFRRVAAPAQILHSPISNLGGLKRLAIVGVALLTVRAIVQIFDSPSGHTYQSPKTSIGLAREIQSAF